MIKIISSAFLGSLALAGWAAAEEVVISAPVQAGSLHEGPLDMVAYYMPLENEGVELTATFRARTDSAEPVRIRMRLEDGDDVSFSVPGYLASLYRFARHQETVRMSVDHNPLRVVNEPAPKLRVARAAPPAVVID